MAVRSPGARMRALLDSGQPVLAPGCGDALSARLIEQHGFSSAYISGGWTSGSRGFQDIEILTMTEMLENAHYIAQGVSIPVIADVDTGFGASENVRRTVREFELVGIAGVQIEDQASPKKCGLLAGKECVAPEAMAEKVAVAVDARRDPDTLIVARTDALETYGLEDVLRRGEVYFDAGANVLFVEGLRTEEEAEAVGAAFPGRHLIFNRTPRGYSPAVPIATLHGWGFNLVIFPMQLVLAAVTVMNEALAQIAETGTCDALEDRMMDIEAFFAIAERRATAKQA